MSVSSVSWMDIPTPISITFVTYHVSIYIYNSASPSCLRGVRAIFSALAFIEDPDVEDDDEKSRFVSVAVCPLAFLATPRCSESSRLFF